MGVFSGYVVVPFVNMEFYKDTPGDVTTNAVESLWALFAPRPLRDLAPCQPETPAPVHQRVHVPA